MEYLVFSPIPTAPPITNHAISPIEHGSAIQAILNFAEGLSGMKDGTFDEWTSFIDKHFDPSARFQLQLTSNHEENEAKMRCYDIPASSLSRFFISLSENGVPIHRLILSDISESPPSPESGLSLVETDQVEWHCRDRIWKGHLSVEVGIEISLNIMVIHRMELILLLDKGDNIPENALRVLKMAEQMEVMLEIIGLTEDQQLNPNDALKQITEPGSSI
ncbi:hypothetical protein I204_04785 [Kwoniella mangroviensis CBS 8886]|uniref:uncharacterized protein n=1 Tax=Kwoniella mangroviensis CBS 8507 TaxID=1296122 RepID=UPI00080D5568|nr:uncharacterized protein I203_06200 [Kwoniella mangroviensis CBS 8507]OCF64470.1 hypothetical protein I203_06200 [Kwoniella mangroviensis CBS 8507]OCF74411.1 hypothetical protein I204_04785 [Kwoniella mangroviensis CBS 8886]